MVSNEELKKRVLDNFVKLVSGMRAKPISDWLIQEGIISVEEWHGIEASGSGRTRIDVNRALLRLLLTQPNPETFQVFRRALAETESPYLQELLDQPSKRRTVEQVRLDVAFIANGKHEENAEEREAIRNQLESEDPRKQVEEIQRQLNLEKDKKKKYKKELEDVKQQLKREKKTLADNKKAMGEMKIRLQRQQDLIDRKDTDDNKENAMDPKMKNSYSAKQTPKNKKKNVRPLSSPEKTMPSEKKQQKEITSFFLQPTASGRLKTD